MEDQNLFRCLHGVIIPLLNGIKYYLSTKIMVHEGNEADVNFRRDFVLFVEGSRIHNR